MSKLKKKKSDEKYGDGGEVVSEWKSRITRMKKYATKNQKNWERNRKLLFGASDDSDGGDNEYAFGWGLVKSLETSIYVQNPEMMVEPYSGDKMELGHILTNIANYDIDQMSLKALGNLGLIDNFISGFFACIETVETDKDTVDDDGEEKPVVKEQRFAANRIAPKDFLVDPQWKGLVDLSAARYLAIATYPTVASLKGDKATYADLPDEINEYPEASQEKRSTGSAYDAKGGQNRNDEQGEKDPAYKTICVWECHDKVKQEVVYVTDHKMKEIGSAPWAVKYRIGARSLFPVTLMVFHPMADAWPKAELDLIANQLIKLNKIDAEIYQTVFNHWNKHVTWEGVLSLDQQAKLTDMTVQHSLLVASMDEMEKILGGLQAHQLPNLAEVVAPIPNPEPKKDSLAIRDMCKSEIMDIVGYGPPDRAGMPKTRSAREAVAVKEKLEARLAKRADAVADFYRDFGQKHIMALQQVMALPRYVRVFDAAKNLAEFQQYAKEDIKDALFNFVVYAGTSAPKSTEAKKQQEVQLFQTLMPLVQSGQIPPEPPILRLAEAFQWKGVDALLRNYKPAMKNLAKALVAMKAGKVKPSAVPEAAAAAVQAALTPEELKMLAQEMAQEQQGGGGGGGGQVPPEKVQQNRGDPGGQDTMGAM